MGWGVHARGTVDWDGASDAFCQYVEPEAQAAEDLGVFDSIEQVGWGLVWGGIWADALRANGSTLLPGGLVQGASPAAPVQAGASCCWAGSAAAQSSRGGTLPLTQECRTHPICPPLAAGDAAPPVPAPRPAWPDILLASASRGPSAARRLGAARGQRACGCVEGGRRRARRQLLTAGDFRDAFCNRSLVSYGIPFCYPCISSARFFAPF